MFSTVNVPSARSYQSGGDITPQVTKGHIQTPAIRALVIAELDERIGGVHWTVCVVHKGRIGSKRRERFVESTSGCRTNPFTDTPKIAWASTGALQTRPAAIQPYE